MQALRRDDFDVRIAGDGVDFRTKEFDGRTMAWVVLPKGANLAPALAGLDGDLCQCPHWGYVIKGHVRMNTSNGSTDHRAGEAFYWGPGHAPEAIEDSEYIDVSPSAELEAVIAHITRG
jgi:hypothetical protein